MPLSSSHSWIEHVNEALGYLKKKDMMSLRSTYRRIFDKIIVRRLDAAKVRLQFVFKNLSTPNYIGEVANCMSVGRVEFSNRDTESVLIPQFLSKLSIYVASPPIPEGVLKRKYLENRLSMLDIAREFACSKTHIRNQLLKHKIPLRVPHKYSNHIKL